TQGHDGSATSDRPAPRWLQALLFLLIYGLFQWAYQSVRTSRWDHWFIHELTVRPAASLVDFISSTEAVQASGYRLIWPGGSLALRAGCDGFEVLGLFIAAVLVADVGWRRGFVALVGGCVVIWALNQLRIAALYAAVRYARSWFASLHTGWGPLILVTAVALIYAWTVRRPAGADCA
ncbi:MAG TPA: exosortase/archaeosortase family protein, partial [Chloroflexota bacterium]|nr:exosortase/archaeosortase family protein [Chloroflexota bacterium]